MYQTDEVMMASIMDSAVQNITNALKDTGLWNDTFLLFTADKVDRLELIPNLEIIGLSVAENTATLKVKYIVFNSVAFSNSRFPIIDFMQWLIYKYSILGGVRAAAFVTGGYVPEDRKGKTLDGYIHICDWYTTFAVMVGVDLTKLPPLTNETIPGYDGYNVMQ